jgi:anti-sigma regulatory factor (Ser/Thr protein kinase)
MIQVWNGGCPPLLLTEQDGATVTHRFISRHLPLGILAPDEFDSSIEHYSCTEKDARLFLSTDGVTELPDASGAHQGLHGLLQKVQRASVTSDFFDALLMTLEAELGGAEPNDDIALIQLDCSIPDTPEGGSGDVAPVAVRFANHWPLPCDARDEHLSEWDFSVTLQARQIRQLDVIPFLLGITGQLEKGAAANNLYLILSELFNNALDHGLLMLDSKIKSEVDGMERYFSEREARLAALVEGRIEISLAKLANPVLAGCKACKRQVLKIRVSDTGSGFDHTRRMKELDGVEQHGRGIPLLHQLCTHVQYFGSGAEVVVYVDMQKFDCSLPAAAM